MWEMHDGCPNWKHSLREIAVIWITQGSAVDGALSFNGCGKMG
jgi:hypothetical protein